MPLPGADKYRTEPLVRKLTWEQKVIKKANDDIHIEDVLSKYYGIEVPYDAFSWKVRCPYALEHEDGGLDKQFRIYSDSNSGYCFAMHGRVDNIRLYRDTKPYLSVFDTAKELLEEFDIDYRQKSYNEIFDEVAEAAKIKLNYQDIIDAMRFYLQSFDQYNQVEYSNTMVNMVGDFNQQAKVVCAKAESLEEVQEWYQQQKEVMKHYLTSQPT